MCTLLIVGDGSVIYATESMNVSSFISIHTDEKRIKTSLKVLKKSFFILSTAISLSTCIFFYFVYITYTYH